MSSWPSQFGGRREFPSRPAALEHDSAALAAFGMDDEGRHVLEPVIEVAGLGADEAKREMKTPIAP